MGVTVQDLFGGAGDVQPAPPGSYGEAPHGYRLPESTRLGPVRLQVTDLGRSLAFYERILGLRLLGRDGGDAHLGAEGDDRPLVELHEQRGAGGAGRGRLGLYHFALLLPDRPALGRFMRHLAAHGVRAGAADHLVSEALYLNDPDDLGIEVYADRPRSAWRRIGRELMLATDPLDADDLVRAAGDEMWGGMPVGTTVGHVHLHVGDLTRAAAFFSEALGFDRVTWRYPGALFFGAGGYHHHVGANTWAGHTARPPAPHEPQLLEWRLELPAAEVARTVASLGAAGYGAEHVADDEAVVRDPWGTAVRLNGRSRTG